MALVLILLAKSKILDNALHTERSIHTRQSKQHRTMAGVQLSEAAAQRIINYTQSHGGVGLRLGLRKAGCSGWAYTVDMASEITEQDVVCEDRGAKVVFDERWLNAFDGVQVDFVKDGLNQSFRFTNPNVKGECGCGESIAI